MRSSCFLFCEGCGKNVVYNKGRVSVCSFCKKEIQIEKGVEDLVIALNNVGIFTTSSCEGHKNGFDIGKRTYPCVALFHDNKKIKKIIADYNEKITDSFVTLHQQTILGWKNLLLPKETSKNLKELQKETFLLARYIADL